MGILDKIANALGSGPKTFNVLVVGLDNSGKSTILNSLKTENKSSPESISPTVGAQVRKFALQASCYPSEVSPVLKRRFSDRKNKDRKCSASFQRHVWPRKIPTYVGTMP